MRTSRISDIQQHHATRLSLSAFLPTQTSYRVSLLIIAVALPAVALYLGRTNNDAAPAKASQSVSAASAVTPEASAESSVSGNQARASAATTPQAAASSDGAQGSATNNNQTNIEVNGRHIPVPASGQLHTTITDQNSTTDVDVSSSGDSSNSNTNLSIQSSSSSSTNGTSSD